MLAYLLFTSLLMAGFGWYRMRMKPTGRRAMGQGAAQATDRGEAERRLAERTALEQAKNRMLMGRLNDLRTPLLLILTPLRSWLREEAASGETAPEAAEAAMVTVPRDDLKRVFQYANQLRYRADQVTEMLSFELGDQELTPARADLVRLLDLQIRALRPLAERYGIRLAFSSEAPALWCAFDRPKIEQVVHGLLQRVFEDTEPGHAVEVVLSRQPGHVVLEMRDDGRTISEAHRRLLTVADPAVAESIVDMTGLSLVLCRRYVALHGGRCEVEPGTRGGTRVQVWLPVQETATRDVFGVEGDGMSGAEVEIATGLLDRVLEGQAEAAPAPASGEPAGEQATLLVVDDHEATRRFLSMALRKHYHVLQAADGEAALALVRAHQPDLVISDIMMPGMGGNELCRLIKTDEALGHIPVMLVTANAIPEVKREGLASGADDYLVKPFDLDEALIRIDNLIQGRMQLKRHYSRSAGRAAVQASEVTVNSADEMLLDRARAVVEQHIEESDFGVQELAAELGMSPCQLQRRLREMVDQSPVEFIRLLRLQRAAQLLEQQYGNISEVAYSVGFTSLSYFAKCFREQFGMSPSEYKAEQPLA